MTAWSRKVVARAVAAAAAAEKRGMTIVGNARSQRSRAATGDRGLRRLRATTSAAMKSLASLLRCCASPIAR
jgi:hypothetical protein